SRPRSVRAYSTVGGEVGMTRREITPIRSNSTSRAESTFAEIPLTSRRSSLNLRGASRRYQMTCGFHAPPMTRMHTVSGHSAGGGATLFLRIGTDTILSSYSQVTQFFGTGLGSDYQR